MAEIDGLATARALVAGGEWQAALDALAADTDDPAALELRAQATYGNGDFEQSITAWEQAHDRYVALGDPVQAAVAASTLAMFLLIDTGMMAPVRGWLRRAERLVDGMDEVPPHALIALVRTYERFMSGDVEGVRVASAAARDLGERLGVMPALVIGRVAAARLDLLEGRVDEGLEQLDEMATLLMSGDVDPLTTGMMYCELICAAQALGLHDRAVAWTDLMERWRHGAAFGGLNGRCRVHRAEMLRLTGPCGTAEEEALLACEELRPWMRREFGWPLVELGNIRLRKGDLAGAEEAYLQAHERAWSAHPGLALLRLAQGDVAAATLLIDEAVADPFDLPWKEQPPIGELRMAPLLEAQVEIAVAAGDAATAAQASATLDGIAERFAGPVLQAGADLARARARLAAGDLAEARRHATAAMQRWTEIGAPFDAAVARAVLADVRRREGNEDAARLEWQTARRAFAAFGAEAKVHECDAALAAGATEASPAPMPARRADAAGFTRVGDDRIVELGGHRAVLPDLKGLRHIARLLAEPGREFHALDLVAVEAGTLASPHGRAVDAGIPVLDEAAIAAYRRRLAEVDEDIDDATAMHDPARRERAERDRDYLLAELRSAVGLAGRPRTTGGTAEKARVAVARSIRYALERLDEQHPLAAAHLRSGLRTGTYCSYAPDPLSPVEWTV